MTATRYAPSADWFTEYGVPDTVRGALDLTDPRRAPSAKLRNAQHYVKACRRVARRAGRDDLATIDLRLIEVGYNLIAPSKWIREGHLERFVAYYGRAVVRPQKVGSSRNHLEPCEVYYAMRVGIPATLTAHLSWAVIHGRNPSDNLAPRGRVSKKGVRRMLRIARARSRKSARWMHLTAGAAARLGRLSPAMQAAAIQWWQFNHSDGHTMCPKDIDWEFLAVFQRDGGASFQATKILASVVEDAA